MDDRPLWPSPTSKPAQDKNAYIRWHQSTKTFNKLKQTLLVFWTTHRFLPFCAQLRTDCDTPQQPDERSTETLWCFDSRRAECSIQTTGKTSVTANAHVARRKKKIRT